MPMLGVMFQADPEKAASSLAGVFLELLLQKDCYLRYLYINSLVWDILQKRFFFVSRLNQMRFLDCTSIKLKNLIKGNGRD